MWWKIGSVIAGLAAWVVIATILDARCVWCGPITRPRFPRSISTLPDDAARLTEGAVTTIAAGWFARWIARTPLWLAYVQGALILLGFLPVHYKLWHDFPVLVSPHLPRPPHPADLLGASLRGPHRHRNSPKACRHSLGGWSKLVQVCSRIFHGHLSGAGRERDRPPPDAIGFSALQPV